MWSRQYEVEWKANKLLSPMVIIGYEATQDYRKEMMQKKSKGTEEDYHFALTMFLDIHEQGLIISLYIQGSNTDS